MTKNYTVKKNHISVCICTYKRPKMLANLLNELQNQITNKLFTYSIVVVDNDHARSAESIVASCKKKQSIAIDYYNEPEQNIALARNKAVENAKGNLIAFIDDDEFPVNDWLLNLYEASIKFNADGVLGPVKPYFESEPPEWVVKSKLCERKSFNTGTILKDSRDTRTGNVLLSTKILLKGESFFNPAFGRTGGEDTDFFRRMIAQNKIFIWCNEAPVYETVPEERLKKAYFLKRALLRGIVNSRRESFNLISVLKSIIAFVLYTSALPFLFLLGRHWFMKYLTKDCDHIGKLLGVLSLAPVNEKNF